MPNKIKETTEAETLMRDVMLRRPVSMEQAERGLLEIQRMRYLIADLQAANIRAGQALVAAFEYIDGLAGEAEMRAALNAYSWSWGNPPMNKSMLDEQNDHLS